MIGRGSAADRVRRVRRLLRQHHPAAMYSAAPMPVNAATTNPTRTSIGSMS